MEKGTIVKISVGAAAIIILGLIVWRWNHVPTIHPGDTKTISYWCEEGDKLQHPKLATSSFSDGSEVKLVITNKSPYKVTLSNLDIMMVDKHGDIMGPLLPTWIYSQAGDQFEKGDIVLLPGRLLTRTVIINVGNSEINRLDVYTRWNKKLRKTYSIEPRR